MNEKKLKNCVVKNVVGFLKLCFCISINMYSHFITKSVECSALWL